MPPKKKKRLEECPLQSSIIMSNAHISVKNILLKKVETLKLMNTDNSEYFKLKQWIETVNSILSNPYNTLPISKLDPHENIVHFMKNTRQILDNTVYGLVDTKVQLMRIIAQWITNPSSNGNCIGIQGPAGIGKTSLIKDGLSKALNVPFAFVALGGASDAAFLDGYSYTYEGSRHGKIAEILLKTKCNNPIIFFDELDKVSLTKNGQEIISVLTHITDLSQNNEFNDKYFGEINIDLSRCVFIFSYNDESLINPILKDRMITINASGYSKKEKLIIAKDYIIPAIFKTFERNTTDIVFTDAIIEKIIDIVPREEGVRNLKRGIEAVTSWINMYMYTDEMIIEVPFVVTDAFIEKHLTKKEIQNENMAKMYN